MPPRLRTVLLITPCLVLWLAAHVVPAWTWVFPSAGEVRFFEVDSYFHYRQVRTLVHHGFSRLDLGASYPSGERSANLGGYDVLLAGVSLAAGMGHPSDLTIRMVMAWAPVLCGLGMLLGLFALARRLPGPAWLAPWLLLLVPGPLLGYTMLGFADHHAFESMLAVLTCLGVVCCLERDGVQPGVLEAMPAVLLFLSWNGAVLYVIAAVAAFMLALLAAGRDDAPVAQAWIRWSLGALVIYAPLWLFVPDALLSIALGRLILVGLTVPPLALTVLLKLGKRAEGRFAAALTGAAAISLALPAVRHAAAELVTARGVLVSEDVPVTLTLVGQQFGVLAPLAVVALARRKSGHAIALAAVTGFTIAWAIIWWGTTKCGYVLPPFVALLAATTLARLWDALPSAAARAALAAAVLLPLWPLQWVLSPWPPQERLALLMQVNDDLVDAMTWLRDRSPPLPCPLDGAAAARPSGRPDWYGVFTPWDFGHLVPALAERPTLFAGDVNGEAARILLETDEDAAVETLAPAPPNPRQTRYVVLEARALADFVPAEIVAAGYNLADYRTAGAEPTFGPRYAASLMARLYLDGAQGMRHFRRVHDSPGGRILVYREDGAAYARLAIDLHGEGPETVLAQAAAPRVHRSATGTWYDAVWRPAVRVFQLVRGARLRGVSTPGRTVRAVVPLISATYEQTAEADPSGAFELVIPYPTERFAAGDIQPSGAPCLVSGAEGSARVSVTEAQVEQGQIVPVVLTPGGGR